MKMVQGRFMLVSMIMKETRMIVQPYFFSLKIVSLGLEWMIMDRLRQSYHPVHGVSMLVIQTPQPILISGMAAWFILKMVQMILLNYFSIPGKNMVL